MPLNLFITGCYRSGTTLLEKLLHQHPLLCVASQPFPVLYFHFKEAFNRHIGIERRYPLDHLFLEDGYKKSDFLRFLGRHVITDDDLDRIFSALSRYDEGLWTKEVLAYRSEISPGRFIDIYDQLNSVLTRIHAKEGSQYKGGKEILCEEYIPFLLQNGVKTVVVIRDPRDMVTSLNFKEKYNLTGDNRPVLYSVRVWRKSVAFALAHASHPDFIWITYEELVSDTLRVLNRIGAFLGIDEFKKELFENGIHDQYGRLWKGNSSFEDQRGISSASIGKFRGVLPNDVTRFIEACCQPEMSALGYPLEEGDGFDPEAVMSYRDPFEVNHAKFPSDYSSCQEHAKEEIDRYDKLSKALSDDEIETWFLFDKCYRALREAI